MQGFVQEDDGSWTKISEAFGPIEVDESSPEWEESVPTLQRFSGSLTFLMEPRMREAFVNFINAAMEIGERMQARPRISAMHSAYRRKTRRRSRR